MSFVEPVTIKEAVEKIHKKKFLLPAIQREFVWSTDQIERLFDSLMRDYPISSFLFWEVEKKAVENYQFYEFVKDFHERDNRHNPKAEVDTESDLVAVLDGQQRLTSLYQAFFGVGEHRYYLKLNVLMEGGDFEEAIFNVRSTTKWVKAHEDFKLQAKEMILPLYVLRNGAGGFLQWLFQVTNPMPNEQRIAMQDKLNAINNK